jgi:hypothetical protein
MIMEMFRQTFRGPVRRGPLLALLAAGGLEAARTLPNGPAAASAPADLALILDVAVLHAVVVEGLASGLTAAALTTGYMTYALWPKASTDDLDGEARRRIATHAAAALTITGFVAVLRRRKAARPPAA